LNDNQRRKEFYEKLHEAVTNTLGDYTKRMWYIDGLFTAPSSQGQGYGSALLDTVTCRVRRPIMPARISIIRHECTTGGRYIPCNMASIV
jgi:GNAT superfamily N-acetyltransferase